jgi:hypothetical protein
MKRSPASSSTCPSCLAPLVEIRLGVELTLRSCSACDSRYWSRGDDPAELDVVLSAVADDDRRRRLVRTGA